MAIYLTLASLGLLGFWLYYMVMLRKRTFFSLNRAYLLLGLVLCLVLPLSDYLLPGDYSIQELGEVPFISSTAKEVLHRTQASLNEFESSLSIPWLLIAYCAGCTLLLCRFCLSLRSIKKFRNQAHRGRLRGTKVFYSKQVTQPMSIFKTIYFPISYLNKVPDKVLLHEKAHVRQLHFMDLLLAELMIIILWFNPIAYLYKAAIKLNLEYLADKAAMGEGVAQLEYQSVLLSYALGKGHHSPITTNFTTPLKNRIEMMKKRKSKTWSRVSLLGAIPIAVILVAMNISKEIKAPIEAVIEPLNDQLKLSNKPSGLPIAQAEKIKMSAGYGERYHPILKVKKLHTGIDLVAKSGTPVYATASGEVIIAKSNESRGNYLLIKHSEEYETQYAHLKQYVVAAGDPIKKGQVIGYVGNTGKSMGPHLHYEVHKNGSPVNPEEYL